MLKNGRDFKIGVVINGFKLLKTYKRFWLWQRPSGVRECFLPFETPKKEVGE